MSNVTLHLPALLEENLGISRSMARQMIDTGKVSLAGAILSPGEHDAAVRTGVPLTVERIGRARDRVLIRTGAMRDADE